MKILDINEYRPGKWKVVFEESPKIPLILGKEPTFQIGDEIPEDKMKLIDKGDYQYYVWKQAATKYAATSDKDISIRAQVAVKILSDLICAGKLDAVIEPSNYAEEVLQTWINRSLALDNIEVDD